MVIAHIEPNSDTVSITRGFNRLSDVGPKNYAFREFLDYTKEQIVAHFTDEVTKESLKVSPDNNEIQRRQGRVDRLTSELSNPVDHDKLFDILLETSIPVVNTNVTKLTENDLPSSDFAEYRGAWSLNTNTKKVEVNLTKARDIQLVRLRAKRNDLLAKYDGKVLEFTDKNDTTSLSDARSKKQQLRDATNALKALSNPQSIDEIKAATPNLDEF